MLALLMLSLFVAQADVGTPPAQLSPAAALPAGPTAIAGVGGAAFRNVGYCIDGGGCGSAWGGGGVASVGADQPVGGSLATRVHIFGGHAYDTDAVGMMVSLRGAVVQQPALVFSPWVTAGVGLFDGDMAAAGMAGVAFDVGGKAVRLDASLPLVGAMADPGSGVEPLQGGIPFLSVGELGLRWEVGEQSSVRVGFLGVLPGVDWQRKLGDDGKVLQVGVHGLGYVNTVRVGFTQPM